MKIQCKDGIFETGKDEFNSYNAERIHLQFVSVGREGVRVGKPSYQTPITVDNAKAVLDAQVRKAQRQANAEAIERQFWLITLSNNDLVEMLRSAFAAEMTLPLDVESEMCRRGLLPKLTVEVNADFAQYVEAKNKTQREGRGSAFEDGIN